MNKSDLEVLTELRLDEAKCLLSMVSFMVPIIYAVML